MRAGIERIFVAVVFESSRTRVFESSRTRVKVMQHQANTQASLHCFLLDRLCHKAAPSSLFAVTNRQQICTTGGHLVSTRLSKRDNQGLCNYRGAVSVASAAVDWDSSLAS